MDKYTKEELAAALRVVSSTISNCEKAQLKFAEGTSHHTVLRNRIKAMYISKSLITDEKWYKQIYKRRIDRSATPSIFSY